MLDRLGRRAGLLALAWSVAVGASFLWNRAQLQHNVTAQARSQARASIVKDLTYRGLISAMGGVYARTGPVVVPSPYLSHIPDRDITAPGGHTLTLLSSSYFLRLAHDDERRVNRNGIHSSAVSLHPLNPANAPEPWERGALEALAKGASEQEAVEQTPTGARYRLLVPSTASADCLACHAQAGAKEGGLLGGISVEVPLAPLTADAAQRLWALQAGHLVLWVIGLAGLLRGYALFRVKERALRQAAHYDTLTGLPNRALLADRLDQALRRARRHGTLGALCYLDIDRFKTINDSLGHAFGDGLLKEVARTLQSLLREEDTVARLGGDEFVVLFNGLGEGEEEAVAAAQNVAHKVLEGLSRRFQVDGHELHTTASIGISLFPSNADTASDLLKQADTAMYRAKESGGNAFRFYRDEMQEAADQRLRLENELCDALERGEFELYYQPQLEMKGNRVVAAEALLRWHHPTRGLLSPAEFLTVAEETGLIQPLGDWVLLNACRQLAAWDAAGRAPLRMAVNVSPRQFRRTDFVPSLCRILEESGLRADRLVLEITEAVLLRDPEETRAKLEELHGLGVELCVDDFGVGYSSLAHLKHLPVQTIKIDRSFVHDIPRNANDVAITETILAVAWRFGLRVVAEGVEEQVQRDFLTTRGCDVYQGHLFSPAVPAGELDAFLPPAAAA